MVAVRTALGADALPGADRHLAPGSVLHARHQFVAVAGLRFGGPLVQPPDLLAHAGRGGRVEQRVPRLLRGAAVQPEPAQVVAAALEDGERGCPAEQRLERSGQARQVTVDKLPLQRDRRGGNHYARPGGHRVRRRGDEVGEGLARSGARLDGQVFPGEDGPLHRLGHGDLPGPLPAADPGHRRGQQIGHARPIPGALSGNGPGRTGRIRGPHLRGLHVRSPRARGWPSAPSTVAAPLPAAVLPAAGPPRPVLLAPAPPAAGSSHAGTVAAALPTLGSSPASTIAAAARGAGCALSPLGTLERYRAGPTAGPV